MTASNQEVDPDEIVNFIGESVSEPGTLRSTTTEQGTLRVEIPATALVEVCRSLKDTAPYYFLHFSRISDRKGAGGKEAVELIYHLYSFNLDRRLQLSVKVDRGSNLPTLRSLWSGAAWPEQNCVRRFNLKFKNRAAPAAGATGNEWAPAGVVSDSLEESFEEIFRFREAVDNW